jgi:hypothetical protein
MHASVIIQHHYINVNVISEKRCILKVLITAVPMLNYVDSNHQPLHCLLASCQNKLILLPILKLALHFHVSGYQAKAYSYILRK